MRRNFVQMPNYLFREAHPANYMYILGTIASHAGEKGICFASLKTLAKESGTKRDTVISAIRYWEGLNNLKVWRRKGGTTKISTTFDFDRGGSPPNRTTSSPPTVTGVVPIGGHKEDVFKKRESILRISSKSSKNEPESLKDLLNKKYEKES